MENRYWVTGVQLGMLKSLNQMNDPDLEQDIENILHEIEDGQYLCEAEDLKKCNSVAKSELKGDKHG